MSRPRPDPSAGEPAGPHGGERRAGDRWVTLEDAAAALKLSQQALWHRLQELRVDVRRIEVGGRQVSGLSSGDLARLGANGGASGNGERHVSQPVHGSNGAAAAHREPAAAPRADNAQVEQPSLWGQLREFERQRDQLGFELHIVRTQLADARARAQQVEESSRVMREEFEHARVDLEAARAETECARAQYAGLAAERAAAQSARDAAHEHAAAMEREMTQLLEIEKASERYCDRLEQRMRSLGAA